MKLVSWNVRGINTTRSRKLQIKEIKLKNTFYNINRTIKNFKKVEFLQSRKLYEKSKNNMDW